MKVNFMRGEEVHTSEIDLHECALNCEKHVGHSFFSKDSIFSSFVIFMSHQTQV